MFIIIALLLLIICVLVIALTVYGVSLRRKQIAYRLAHTEIPDFVDGRPSVSLEDILADKSIPRIPFEEVEIGERLGVGGSGIVYHAIWHKDDEDVEVAMKELLFTINDLQDISLQEFLVEIKLMRFVHCVYLSLILTVVQCTEG